MNNVGVIHGRFQAFHNGHLSYVLRGIENCEHIFIGITNYDIYEEKPYNAYDSVRTNKEANPFSFYHRFMMIKNSLIECGVSRSRFDIVPFPIEYPNKIEQYVPNDGLFFVSIFDEWDQKKLEIFQSKGFKTMVLPSVDSNENRISGTLVRYNIRNDLPWRDLVPNAVFDYIISNDLIPLIKENM